MKTLSIILSLMVASSASAQTTSNADTNSQAQSTLNQTFEGSSSASGVGASPSNNTADCMQSNAMGVSIVGLGVSGAKSKVEPRCAARVEAEFLVNLISMPNGPAKTVAIYHSCAQSLELRHTLVGLGYCEMR
jgi:hypothetical protein